MRPSPATAVAMSRVIAASLSASACCACARVTEARSSLAGSGMPMPLAATTSHMRRTLCMWATTAAIVRPLPPGGGACQAGSARLRTRIWLIRSLTANVCTRLRATSARGRGFFEDALAWGMGRACYAATATRATVARAATAARRGAFPKDAPRSGR